MVVGVEPVNPEAVLHEQVRREPGRVFLSRPVRRVPPAGHNALNGNRGGVARPEAVRRMPALLVLPEILPDSPVIHVVMHDHPAHIAVEGGAGVLLRVVIHVGEVAGVVDRHTLD